MRLSEQDQVIVDELAVVVYAYDLAWQMVVSAGFESGRVPPPSQMKVFWTTVATEARNGAIPGGLRTIVEEVSKYYPENPKFGAYLDDAHPSKGWTHVHRRFIQEQTGLLDRADLHAYFAGDEPEWPQIASWQVNPRDAVAQAVRELGQVRSSKQRKSVHIVIGPGGEGKSTVVMQVAASMAGEPEWEVFWLSSRHEAKFQWRIFEPYLRDGKALCVIIDEAHVVREKLRGFLSRNAMRGALARARKERASVGESGQEPSIHVLLCAHQDGWRLSQVGDIERWAKLEVPGREIRVQDLSLDDARRIITSYRQADLLEELGLNTAHTDEELARQLQGYAKHPSPSDDAALLGAVIRMRTGVAAEVHIAKMLRLAKDAQERLKLPVHRAFVMTAAANAVGIDKLSLEVLALALGRSSRNEEMDAIIACVEGEFRVEGQGETRTVRIRHRAIAKLVAKEAFAGFPNGLNSANKRTTWEALGRAAASVSDTYWESTRAKPILNLRESMVLVDPRVAIAVAKGVVQRRPDDVVAVTTLARVYRETRESADSTEARKVCHRFVEHDPNRLRDPKVRPLLVEWAISSGLSGMWPRSLWLSLWSFSDHVGDMHINKPHLNHVFTVTRALEGVVQATTEAEESAAGGGQSQRVTPRWPLDPRVVRRGAAAVVALGHAIRRLDANRRHKKVAVNLADSVRVEVSEVGAIFTTMAQAVWLLLDTKFREERFLPEDGRLEFHRLATALNTYDKDRRGSA